MNKLVLSSKCPSQISPILNDIQVIVVLGISFFYDQQEYCPKPRQEGHFPGSCALEVLTYHRHGCQFTFVTSDPVFSAVEGEA